MIIAKYLPELRRRPRSGLAIAIALLVLCFALRYFTPLRLTYVPFYPAIMLATFVSGRWIGAGITIAAAFLAVYFFVPHAGFTLSDSWDLGAFLAVSAIIIFATDLLAETVTRLSAQSARLRHSEENTRILMRELTHRMKNQYAVILALARVSEKYTHSVPAFLDAFSRRVSCLARTHDLLVKANWKGVSLADLIDIELEPFAMGHAYSCRGPAVEIKDTAVVHLAMALHELATNSTKHGAWSGEGGTVRIEWHLREDSFVFEWSERDGPEVGRDVAGGFGRTLLERLVPQAVGGHSELLFKPDGLNWTFTAPAAEILAAPGPLAQSDLAPAVSMPA